MRQWRKLFSSIMSSERLSKVSYEARWLYTMLLVAQDDNGQYPWTLTMVRGLTATTDWDFSAATKYRQELQEAGLGKMNGDFFLLRKGRELNGPITDHSQPGWRQTFVYPGTEEQLPLPTPRASQNHKSSPAPKAESKQPESVRTMSGQCQDSFEQEFLRAYSENIGLISSPMLTEEIHAFCTEREWPAEWAREAIQEAVQTARQPSFRYVKAVLERWAQEGRDGPRRGKGTTTDGKEYTKRYGHLVRGKDKNSG